MLMENLDEPSTVLVVWACHPASGCLQRTLEHDSQGHLTEPNDFVPLVVCFDDGNVSTEDPSTLELHDNAETIDNHSGGAKKWSNLFEDSSDSGSDADGFICGLLCDCDKCEADNSPFLRVV